MASRQHNEKVLNSLEEGDLVEFQRSSFYSHWGVYIGNGDVVHFSRNAGDISLSAIILDTSEEATVQREKFFDVANVSKAVRNNKKDDEYDPQPAKEIVRVATSMVGQHIGYNLISFNCEHFASLCRYDDKISYQADQAKGLAQQVCQAALDYIRPSKKSDKTY